MPPDPPRFLLLPAPPPPNIHLLPTALEKEQKAWEMVLKLSTTFIVVCRYLGFTQTGILPGVIVPVFIEFTVVYWEKQELRMRVYTSISTLKWLTRNVIYYIITQQRS